MGLCENGLNSCVRFFAQLLLGLELPSAVTD